jgi:hypothetical protein
VRAFALVVCACLLAAGCRDIGGRLSVQPRALRDVPAERLAFRFEPDLSAESLPEAIKKEDAEEPLAAIRADFDTHRASDALIRTVVSPNGQRALALYATGETQTASTDFRIDLYSTEGVRLRNVLPADLIGAFPAEVAWSPDGQSILFSGFKNQAATPTPTPSDALPEAATPPAVEAPSDPSAPTPTPTVAPIIQSVPAFKTEQIYVGDQDGFNLRPLTQREGLIYFRLAWSPDGSAVAALACKEDEWFARRNENRVPAGRPRIITLDGQERLLDDRLTETAPVWSPDGSKVATAFEYDIAVYDAATGAPTAANLPLRDSLWTSSVQYEEKTANRNTSAAPATTQAAGNASVSPTASPAEVVVNSFNPFVRLEWLEPETLLAQTAFVRLYRDQPPITNYPRWHVVRFYPQAAVVK